MLDVWYCVEIGLCEALFCSVRYVDGGCHTVCFGVFDVCMVLRRDWIMPSIFSVLHISLNATQQPHNTKQCQHVLWPHNRHRTKPSHHTRHTTLRNTSTLPHHINLNCHHGKRFNLPDVTNKKEVVALGGIAAILKALRMHETCEDLAGNACGALGNIAGGEIV